MEKSASGDMGGRVAGQRQSVLDSGVMQSTLNLQELYSPIASQMAEVRDVVAGVWGEAVRLVYDDMNPPSPSGKMLRPAMALLSAGASGHKKLDDIVPLAASMELLHMAALAHDDVIDDSDMRRGIRSWNAQWDNHTAVLGGDYLVARAIALLGKSYDSCAVIVNAIDSVRMMAEGELTNFGLGPNHYSQEGCISLARQKTASLFAVTCSTPTYLADLQYRDSLHEFGMAFGIAFQLIDDVLDLVQNRETLGKPSCGDVVEGKKTLALLYLREALDNDQQRRLDGLAGKELSNDDRDWIAGLMESTGARERVENLARSYCDTARANIEHMPAGTYRDAMLGVNEFILTRDS